MTLKIKRVLFIGNQAYGLCVTRRELIQAFLENGFDIFISVPDEAPDVPLVKKCTMIGNSISRFGTNPLSELKTVLALRKQIRQVNPNAVVTFTIKPNLYSLIACGWKYPVIANVTGLSSFLFKSGLVPKIIAKIQNMMFKRAFCLFCQNRETYERFERLGLKNIRLLPGSGVNVETICYTEYPLYSGKIECTFVARVQKDKGYWEFVEASKRLPDWHFTVIGDGEDQAIVDAFKDCSNISYIGKLPHAETLKKVAESHVLILPSYHEGMANVILEAHALGRPVLTTNVAGCIDAIEDGKTGISFVPESSDAIIDVCNRFASLSWDEWKQMGVEGRKFVEENFDRRIVVDEYMKAIREAVGK